MIKLVEYSICTTKLLDKSSLKLRPFVHVGCTLPIEKFILNELADTMFKLLVVE